MPGTKNDARNRVHPRQFMQSAKAGPQADRRNFTSDQSWRGLQFHVTGPSVHATLMQRHLCAPLKLMVQFTLHLQEKEIARMVTLAFGQKVCGFDLLRSERARSFVCDVNGWSFVKNSHKVRRRAHRLMTDDAASGAQKVAG